MPSRCGVPPLHARARERTGEKENGREELDLSLATQPPSLGDGRHHRNESLGDFDELHHNSWILAPRRQAIPVFNERSTNHTIPSNPLEGKRPCGVCVRRVCVPVRWPGCCGPWRAFFRGRRGLR